MPIVTIQLMEGRDPQRLEEMAAAVATAISETIEAPIESVRVMINEMREHQYSVGGRPIRVVKAERAAADEATDLAEGTAASATATTDTSTA